LIFFKETNDNKAKDHLIDILENVEQKPLPPPLPPIPQPRSKYNQKHSDLLLLGDPGSPVPPPSTIAPKNELENSNLFISNNFKPNTDLDLLGDPGSPPPTPPLF
jgi:hypothetical protein